MGIDEYEGLNPRIQRGESFGEFIHLKERCKTSASTSYRGE